MKETTKIKKPSLKAKVLGLMIISIVLFLLGSPFIALGVFLQWYFF